MKLSTFFFFLFCNKKTKIKKHLGPHSLNTDYYAYDVQQVTLTLFGAES